MEMGGFGVYFNQQYNAYEIINFLKEKPLNFLMHLKMRKSNIKDRIEQLMNKNIED